MKERQKHIDAFEKYFIFKQGGNSVEKTIRLLEGDLGVTRKTLYQWKKVFNWDDREAVRSLEINKRVGEETNSMIVANKVWYLSFLHRLLKDLEEKFDIKIWSVSDLRRTIDGCLVLQGESSENVVQNSQVDVNIHDRIRERAEYYRQLERKSNGTD